MKDFIFLVLVEKINIIQAWDAGFADPVQTETIVEKHICYNLSEVENLKNLNKSCKLTRYDCFKKEESE